MNHRKLSRSWSSGSKCQLSLTDGSLNYSIYVPEAVKTNVIEYLPIYPKKANRVKRTQWRKKKLYKNQKNQYSCVVLFLFRGYVFIITKHDIAFLILQLNLLNSNIVQSVEAYPENLSERSVSLFYSYFCSNTLVENTTLIVPYRQFHERC